MQEALTAIQDIGFPICVTAFLLVRIETKLGALNESIKLLAQTIAQSQK